MKVKKVLNEVENGEEMLKEIQDFLNVCLIIKKSSIKVLDRQMPK